MSYYQSEGKGVSSSGWVNTKDVVWKLDFAPSRTPLSPLPPPPPDDPLDLQIYTTPCTEYLLSHITMIYNSLIKIKEKGFKMFYGP